MGIVTEEITYPSADRRSEVWARIWRDENAPPQFALQISHGMCEYADRYDHFARYICGTGGVVCGNDHLGHGHTRGHHGLHGFFSDRDGHRHLVDDVHGLCVHIRQLYPGIPRVLLGHSMGSFIARNHTAAYPEDFDAVIYMGTCGKAPAGLLKALAAIGKALGRAQKPSPMLTRLAFGGYNKKCADIQSPNDWLTRDRDIVARYDADPWCTFRFTSGAFHDLASLMGGVTGAKWAQRLPRQKPYLVVSGEMDPVGGYGAGVRDVAGWMRDAGIPDVDLKLYPGARHEVLNETNRDEVYGDIHSWIAQAVG